MNLGVFILIVFPFKYFVFRFDVKPHHHVSFLNMGQKNLKFSFKIWLFFSSFSITSTLFLMFFNGFYPLFEWLSGAGNSLVMDFFNFMRHLHSDPLNLSNLVKWKFYRSSHSKKGHENTRQQISQSICLRIFSSPMFMYSSYVAVFRNQKKYLKQGESSDPCLLANRMTGSLRPPFFFLFLFFLILSPPGSYHPPGKLWGDPVGPKLSPPILSWSCPT